MLVIQEASLSYICLFRLSDTWDHEDMVLEHNVIESKSAKPNSMSLKSWTYTVSKDAVVSAEDIMPLRPLCSCSGQCTQPCLRQQTPPVAWHHWIISHQMHCWHHDQDSGGGLWRTFGRLTVYHPGSALKQWSERFVF